MKNGILTTRNIYIANALLMVAYAMFTNGGREGVKMFSAGDWTLKLMMCGAVIMALLFCHVLYAVTILFIAVPTGEAAEATMRAAQGYKGKRIANGAESLQQILSDAADFLSVK